LKRNTPQRQMILDAINNLASHPTAEEVYLRVSKTHPTISRATVYRNLAFAVQSGEISSAGILDGAMRYDHNNHEHFHFVCDRCKKIVDVLCFDLNANLPTIADLKIKKVELILRGTCKDCEEATGRVE